MSVNLQAASGVLAVLLALVCSRFLDLRLMLGAALIFDEMLEKNPTVRFLGIAFGAFIGFVGAFASCRYFLTGMPTSGWAIYFAAASIYWLATALLLLAPRGRSVAETEAA